MKKISLDRNRRSWMGGSLACLLAASLALTGCAGGSYEDTGDGENRSEKTENVDGTNDWDGDWASLIDIPGMDFDYSDRDRDASFDAASATTILLSGSGASIDGNGATSDGSTVNITAEGTYVLSGELAGTVQVQATDQDKIQLVLDGVEIRNEQGPALNIQQADKVFVTLAEGSQNVLADGGSYVLADGEDEPNAALFSKDDLTINGTGALTVEGNYRHGVNSKDDLVITGGAISVTAVEDALRGKDCVKISDGSFAIIAGEDGVKSSNDSDPTRGFVSIDGGEFAIEAGDEGFQAATYLRLTGGNAAIKAGDHALRSEIEAIMTGGEFTVEAQGKGMNAETKFTMDGGVLTIDQSEEGIEAQEVIINDGEVNITSSDDGINAAIAERSSNDNNAASLEVNGTGAAPQNDSDASVNEEQREFDGSTKEGRPTMPQDAAGERPELPEGVEPGQMPEMPEDFDPADLPEGIDGAQAPDGTMMPDRGQRSDRSEEGTPPEMPEDFDPTQEPEAQGDARMPQGGQRGGGFGGGMVAGNASEECLIQVNGGKVSISAGGDAVDSNGYVEVTGGILQGTSTGNGDSALDYEYGATVTGGTVILAGAAGMAENFSADSTQPFAMVSASGQAGSVITITDEKGDTLFTYEATGAFQNIVFSLEGAVDGSAVSVGVDGTAVQTTLSTTPTTSEGFGGRGDMGGAGRPEGRGGKNIQQNNEQHPMPTEDTLEA